MIDPDRLVEQIDDQLPNPFYGRPFTTVPVGMMIRRSREAAVAYVSDLIGGIEPGPLHLVIDRTEGPLPDPFGLWLEARRSVVTRTGQCVVLRSNLRDNDVEMEDDDCPGPG